MLKSGIGFALWLSVMLAAPTARGIAQEAPIAGTAGPVAAMPIRASIDNAAVLTGPDAAFTAGGAANERSAVVLSLDDGTITIERTDTLITADGLVWTGLVRESGDSALLMWANDGGLTGEFSYRGDTYAVATVGGMVHVTPETARQRIADHAPTMLRQTADARARDNRIGWDRKQQRLALATPNVTPIAHSDLRALQANKVTIDLMMLYSPKAAAHYKSSMADLMALAVKQINASFRNSGLENISLRLVHTQLIDYAETDGEHFDHLYRMVDGVGVFNEVHRLRDEKRADIVGLIIDDPSGCGLSTRVAPDAEEAFFVVHHSCAMTSFSIAHEIGHILGARHDRHTDAADSPFPYGHGYVNGTKWRDIMSYQQGCEGCPRIPYWSNPRIMYNGEPTGTDANDNARVILEQAVRVSNFR
jgi:hypothetical protein